jgi:uncharacterized protein (DUF427 family)
MPQRIQPKPGQESVWDYPRPPRLEQVNKRIQIIFNGETIADTTAGYRVLETSHPPVYYLPPADIQMQYLQATTRGSFCEWKGNALYYHLSVGDKRLENVAWAYPTPTAKFEPIADYLAFYAQPMESHHNQASSTVAGLPPILSGHLRVALVVGAGRATLSRTGTKSNY